MYKQTVRYILLVLTPILVIAWGWSYLDPTAIRVGRWSVAVYDGVVFVFRGEAVSNATTLWPYSLRSPNNLYFYGGLSCPIGLVVLLLVLLTASVWYRPIRNHSKCRQNVGFDVVGSDTEIL